MFNQYPYINLNDFNLDYILKAIKDMRYEVTNFVSINAIKYADPIQWNITSQYEKNTIVIDPVTGTAYISVAPVPVGVALTRPEYWTVVFDLQSFVTKANQNLANNYEEQTTTTATMNTAAGDWVIWGDVLYKALVNITAGDAYVVGSNIQRLIIEDVIKVIMQDIADEVQARQDADDALQDAIDDEVQARQDADTALNDRIEVLENAKAFFNTVAEMKADTTLANDDIVICGGYYAKNDGGGAMYSISDTASSNGLYETLDNGLYANIIVADATINVLQIGAKLNDSSFDNSTVFQKAIDSGYNITIPAPNIGVYYMSNSVEIHDLYFKNINAESSNVVYTGSGAAFTVRACHNCIWKFGRITCDTATCFQFVADTEFDNFVDRIDFYFSELQAGTNAVGIDFESYSPSFINEIHVYNGVLARGYYGVLVRNNTASSMNGFHFHDIQVEGVKYGFSFNNDGISHPIMDISIENPRILDMGSGNKFLRTQGYNQNFYIQSATSINVTNMCEINGTLNNVLFDCPNVNNSDVDYRMPAVYRNNELLGANMYTRDVTVNASGTSTVTLKNGQSGLILIYKDADVGSSVVGSSADVGIYVFGCYGNRASVYPIHAANDVTLSATNMTVTVNNTNASHSISVHLISTFD